MYRSLTLTMLTGALALAASAPAMGAVAVPYIPTGDLLVADRDAEGGTGAVIEIGRGTGVRELVSSNNNPVGAPTFSDPTNLAWEPGGSSYFEGQEGYQGDAEGDAILVADPAAFGGSGGVIRVDPETGFRMTVSSNASAAGTPFVDPLDLVVEATGQILVVDTQAFGGFPGIIRVDPGTGARSPVSENNSPLGATNFQLPTGIGLDPATGYINVADWDAGVGAGGSIIGVNPSTGARVTISSNNNPAAFTDFRDPSGIPPDNTGLYVADANAYAGVNGGVISVNVGGGGRATVSQNGNPGGQPNFHDPLDLDVEGTGSIVVTDWTTFLPGTAPGVIRVNSTTGARTRVTENANPVGAPNLAWPWGIIVKPPSFRLVAFPLVVRPPAGGVIAGAKRGTEWTYDLSDAATVVFTIARVGPKGKLTRRGAFSARGRKGLNRKRWSGVLAGKALKPGTYRVTARATTAKGYKSVPVARTFTVKS